MRISERGQITIPKRLRLRYGIDQHTDVELVATSEGVLIKKSSGTDHPVDRVLGILNSPTSTDAYLDEVRGR